MEPTTAIADGAAAAVAVTPFDDPAFEAAYQAARARFVAPKRAQSGAAWLLVSLGVFAAVELAQGGSIATLLLLVGVLFFHELGHYVGMVALGYRDVRMFFMPLIGAAVSGRRGRGSQTREAIALLLGPVPGIVFGTSAAVAAVTFHSTMLKTVAEYLLGLNLLNLLPVVPLDGGRLAGVLLFSRWRWTEGVFVGGTLGTVIVLGLTNGAPLFAAFSFYLLLLLPAQLRMSKVAAALHMDGRSWINDPAALDDGATRTLFSDVCAAIPRAAPKVIAEWMEQVLEIASRRAPPFGRSLTLAAVWAGAFVVGLFALALAAAMK